MVCSIGFHVPTPCLRSSRIVVFVVSPAWLLDSQSISPFRFNNVFRSPELPVSSNPEIERAVTIGPYEESAIPSKRHSPTMSIDQRLLEMTSAAQRGPIPGPITILPCALPPGYPPPRPLSSPSQRWPSEISSYDIPSPPANGNNSLNLSTLSMCYYLSKSFCAFKHE